MDPGMDMNNGTDHDMNMDMGGGMVMTFWFGKDVKILFEGWHTTTTGEFVGACFAIFFVAIFYEFFLAFLERIDKATREGAYGRSEMTPLLSKDSTERHAGFKIRVVRAFLHMLQVFWAYFLMLVFMTYNAGLCISLIVGTGVGYLISGRGQLVSSDSSYCH